MHSPAVIAVAYSAGAAMLYQMLAIANAADSIRYNASEILGKNFLASR